MESNQPKVLEEIATVRLGTTQLAGPMQVVGLRWDAGRGPDYMTLDEALSSDAIVITEVNEKGRVPEIQVTNRSESMVFLMAGEILVGCKQDRVLNTSLMVPARSAMYVSVACVEAGRWIYKSQKFRSFRACTHFDLRKALIEGTFAKYKATGAPGSDQGVVWSEIASKMRTMKFQSSTGAIRDLYERVGNRFDQMERNLRVPDGCQGAAFIVNGKILGADLFDTQSTLSKLWSKIIWSYGMDALEDSKVGSHHLAEETITKWLESAIASRKDLFKSPGAGQDVRMEGELLTGAALLVEGKPVHVQLLAKIPG